MFSIIYQTSIIGIVHERSYHLHYHLNSYHYILYYWQILVHLTSLFRNLSVHFDIYLQKAKVKSQRQTKETLTILLLKLSNTGFIFRMRKVLGLYVEQLRGKVVHTTFLFLEFFRKYIIILNSIIKNILVI